MNKELMFSGKTDLWATPQDFFDALNEEFHFDLNACALPENAKCERYFTPEQVGLKSDASSGENRHKVVPRVHKRESGEPIHQGAVKIRWLQKRGTVSVYGGNF